MIEVQKKEFLLLQPSIIPLPLNFEEKNPYLISMIPGNSQHLLKKISLFYLTTKEYLEEIIKFHINYETRSAKGFFIGELKGLYNVPFHEIAVHINFQEKVEGLYIFRHGCNYFFQRKGGLWKEISATMHAMLIKQFEASTQPSDKALKYGSSGQVEQHHFTKSLRGSKFYSDKSSHSKLRLIELDNLLEKGSIEKAENFIEKYSLTKSEIEELVFLLLYFSLH